MPAIVQSAAQSARTRSLALKPDTISELIPYRQFRAPKRAGVQPRCLNPVPDLPNFYVPIESVFRLIAAKIKITVFSLPHFFSKW